MEFLFLKRFDFTKSLNVKVLASMLATLLAIILFMEISNFYVLEAYQKKAKSTYQNSLKLYSEYWDSKFSVMNNSLVTLASSKSDNDFNNICYLSEGLVFETSRVLLAKKLDEIARINDQFGTFIYIPDRNIYIRSSYHFGSYTDRTILEKEIREYITDNYIRNNKMWDLLRTENKVYLIKIYHIQTGYIGAVIDCKNILQYLIQDKSTVDVAALVDHNNNVVYQLNDDIVFDTSSSSVFYEELELANYKICINASEKSLYSDKTLFVLVLISFLIVGILIVLVNMRVQMKIVLNPLNQLKKAMEEFSRGNMDVRLEENLSSNEINTLYKTFNVMAEQITDLKIDIYESILEKQEIQRSYLRVQIQPHFYTNILNLIYGFAEVGDFSSIQQICIFTSNYFRYLLSNKNTFVTLDREIECVKNYVEIQKMRYPDRIKFNIELATDTNEVLVPPLILQTFVENSIKHNVTYVPVLNVFVDIKQENDILVLSITDNGLGFPKDLLEKLNADDNISEDGKHIGIVNVKQRLRLIYGNNAQVFIESNNENTTVRILIPVNDAKGGGKNENTSCG